MNDTNLAVEIVQVLLDIVVALIVPAMVYVLTNITRLNTNVSWIMAGMKISGDKAGWSLHSPHSPEFDALIEAYWHGTLTREKAKDLADRLDLIIHEDSKNPIEPGYPYSDFQKQSATDMLEAVTALFKIPIDNTQMIKRQK